MDAPQAVVPETYGFTLMINILWRPLPHKALPAPLRNILFDPPEREPQELKLSQNLTGNIMDPIKDKNKRYA